MTGPSLITRLEACGGRPSGFDYLRIALSVAVLCLHSVITSYGKAVDVEVWLSPMRPFERAILPMFFALSGFLVAGSLMRCHTIVAFLGLRVIRIYPALAVEVLLSALILGPLLTTVPLSTYFTATEFWLYLVNVTGHIHYTLPGVFADNPVPRVVNAQLWTVPYELLCYIALSVLAVLGAVRRPWLAPAAAIGLTLAYGVGRFISHGGRLPVIVGGLPGYLLVVSFLLGVSLYLWGRYIPWNRSWFIVSLVLSLVTGSILLVPGMQTISPYVDLFAPFPLAYLTVWLGLTDASKLFFVRRADYSYGVYLYSYAIQQSVMAVAPWAREWWINILICLPLSILFAALSWHLVEKPAMGLKGRVKALEEAYLRWRRSAAPPRPAAH
ncbi:MAG: acyltransferase family protein [Sphingomonadaceae bacterium]